MTMTSTLLSITSDGIIRNPNPFDYESASSSHVLAFNGHGELLVGESEGTFTMDEWDEVYEVGKRVCCDSMTENDAMQNGKFGEKTGSMMDFVKSTMQEKVQADLDWKR